MIKNDNTLNDLLNRVEDLENHLYSVQKSIKNNYFFGFNTVDLGAEYNVTSIPIVLGNVSSQNPVDIILLFDSESDFDAKLVLGAGGISGVCDIKVGSGYFNSIRIFAQSGELVLSSDVPIKLLNCRLLIQNTAKFTQN